MAMGKVINMAGEVISEGIEAGVKKGRNIKNAKEILGTKAPKVRRELDGLRRSIKIDDLEEAFNSGTRIGSKQNHVLVNRSSPIIERYEKELAKNPNNMKSAVKKATKSVAEESNAKRALAKDMADGRELSQRNKIVKENRMQSAQYRINQDVRELNYIRQKEAANPTNILRGKKPDVNNIVSTRELKKNMYDSKESYMKWSQGKKYDEAIDAFKKKDFNNPLLKQLTNEGIDLKQINVDNLQALRQETINKMSAKDMKMVDAMGYYKVPQKVTGVLGTAWLVNKMAATGGQQTNSQLYGQTPY